ncbi:MAG: restriction endonuclease [Acidobacteria bacterium]|nr:restriction endonuclease [Acidobacteriota bacterium]
MPVPDFQTMMLPFLLITGDSKEHTYKEMVDRLAIQFNLTEKEKAELVPSGRQTRLLNRIYWIYTHFKHAKLIYQTKRGVFKITERGLELLSQNIERIDLRTLALFPEYNDFRQKRSTTLEQTTEIPDIPTAKTPDEILYDSYKTIRENLAADLLEKIKDLSPEFFERLVVNLIVSMGYGGSMEDAGQAVGGSGDGGIDGIIKEDRLGLDLIYLQAKRWERTVGRPDIHQFAGALMGKRAKKGVFITTSNYSKEAREYAANIENKIILIDGDELADLMIDYNVGVSTVELYEIKRIDSDYFIEE